MFLKGFWNLVLICLLSPSIDAQSSNFPPPKILDCPPNILHAIPYEETSAIVTWQEPSSDPPINPFRSDSSGSRFNLGKTPVRYTFTSSLAITANCDFTVEVKRIDTTPPEVMQCPRGVSAPISPTERSVSVNWTEPYATDDTGTEVRITKTHSPGDLFVRGFTVVNYTFADTTGNVNSCSFTVTVFLVDNIPPIVVNCPSDITMPAQDHSVYEAVSWMEPSATDETSQTVDLVVYKSHSPGDRFRAGVTNVLYVFADESENSVFCTFQIHLDPPETPSVSSCPRSRVEIVENNDPEPAVEDQEKPQFTAEGTLIEATIPSSSWNKTFVGTQLSTQNDIVCSYDVYIFRVDTIAPNIVNCQSRKEVVTASLGLGGWAGSFTVAETDFTATYNPEAIESCLFPVGETVLAILLEDAAKNSRVCSVSVVVNPTITGCPRGIRGESKTNESSLEVNWPSPTPLRGFPVSATPPSPSSGSLFMLGSTLVQHEFAESMGGSGATEICEFEIFVTEENPLIITSCPDDIVRTLPSDSASVIVTWALPDADNKLGSEFNVIGISTTHNSGDAFSVGETTVVYVFESHDKKFQINCTFGVSVKDTTAPDFQGCPSEVRLSVLAWYGTFDWKKEIIPRDNSNVTEVFASHEANFRYPLGETPVNLTAVDSSGNEAVCSFPVMVSLILPLPVLILIGVVILLVVVFIISCCCCCRRRWSKGDENTTLSQDSPDGYHNNKGYDDQQAKGDKSSKEISGPPLAEGNKYLSEMEMNSIHSPKPTPQNNGEYSFVDEPAPPVPTTPRPNQGKIEYVNDSVDPKKRKKSSAVEPPKLSDEQDYLKPAEHQYLYADSIGNPNEYSYAYDHDQSRHPQS